MLLEEQIPKLHDRRVTTCWRLAWLVSSAANRFDTCTAKQQIEQLDEQLEPSCHVCHWQYSGWSDVGLLVYAVTVPLAIIYAVIDIAGSPSSFFF